jgi:hypothetical protein
MATGEPFARALEMGAVSASFALEGAGPAGLFAADRARALDRL